jgi:hypothetical protein
MSHQKIVSGLKILLDDTRRNADIPLEKLFAMQDIFLEKNINLYSDEKLLEVKYYLRALSYKFHLANLSLSQLWALSDTKKYELFDALQNSLDNIEYSDDELLLISFVFENFLFQAQSYVDFYMLYISIFLQSNHQGSISEKKFFKTVGGIIDGPFTDKAKLVSEYFSTKVFGLPERDGINPNNWGTLLKSLRDRIAHRDIIRPTFNSNETIAGKLLFDWPTLQNITYDRFCQYMQNGMFALIQDVSSILYDLEWKSGVYKPGLWR